MDSTVFTVSSGSNPTQNEPSWSCKAALHGILIRSYFEWNSPEIQILTWIVCNWPSPPVRSCSLRVFLEDMTDGRSGENVEHKGSQILRSFCGQFISFRYIGSSSTRYNIVTAVNAIAVRSLGCRELVFLVAMVQDLFPNTSLLWVRFGGCLYCEVWLTISRFEGIF